MNPLRVNPLLAALVPSPARRRTTGAKPPAPSSPPGPPASGGRARRTVPTVVTALGLFAAARLTGVLFLALLARAEGRDTTTLLGRTWDSLWYIGIATEGYGEVREYSRLVLNDLAFFPLYPWLIRGVCALLPVSGGAAGLLIAWTAAGAAACGIYRIGRRMHGRGVGVALVVLWGLTPHSVVLSLAYTEPLLTALAAWALYATLTGRWLWAGALACLAGLSRPNGLAVAAAVAVAAGWHAVTLLRQRRASFHSLWKPLAGTALAPLGWVGFVLWAGLREGDPLGGYLAVQRRWGSAFDFGRGNLEFAGHLLRHPDKLLFTVALAVVLLALLLLGLLVADRAPLPLVVYSAVLVLITVGGSGYFASKPRFLLPAFPLLLPLAAALTRTARARPWHATLVVAALAGLSFAYGAYLVVMATSPL
ncbi:hypothetical protein [Streptomyces abyssomicinicus]|uniref:hypothetical protein n=1 Tax=Streptomyces abyssomicinicus TaxID=574929 RepID=UPI001FE3CBE8|nr:hypothetical protein [Streptomyces abyssomicinicus]